MCNQACLLFATSYVLEEEVRGKKVLEVGSLNVNGSVRSIIENFEPSSYLGVDVVNGPGVDDICHIDNLVNRFGEESFDLVVSTELLEHVRDWRSAISNLKKVLAPNGILLITTRSRGFGYHGYPFDFWRYEVKDAEILFSDLSIEVIETDPRSPGVFVKGRKQVPFSEKNLGAHKLYSIIRKRRCRDVREFEIYFHRVVVWPVHRFLSRILPTRVQTIIRNAILKQGERARR
jgi:SAM-dependent methyltransferase